jgi:diguanylate cyclase (GGDEF)-like protein
MPQIRRAGERAPLTSLSTKILLFAFASTLATAVAVSLTSIASTQAYLSSSIRRAYPAALERTADRLEPWIAAHRDAAPAPSEQRRAALSRLLAEEQPDAITRLWLLDAKGATIAVAPPLAAGERLAVPLDALLTRPPGAIGEWTASDGSLHVGALRGLEGTGWSLVVDAPFERAYAPVIAVVTRVFVVDLCIVLLFSVLAYRITAAMLRPIEALSDAARRIAQGQFDHEIPETGSRDEIGLLARTFNDMMRRLRGYQSEIESTNRNLTERNSELQQAKETFEQLSITDGLTKLHNHRFFQDHLTREIKRVSRTSEPLAMLLVDIDDFKGLNDRLGHAAGDELLVGIARIMNDTVRESDLLARYGGEEFVVLASTTDLQGAYLLAEKIRTNIAETSFILDDSLRPTRVTVSIGLARYRGSRKTFFQSTDRALYRAKAQGKNCVVVDEDEAAAPAGDAF